ncbi:hypothetical protein OIDMADRAFT_52058 [Oidiodendron maius Zn]|uniref:Uncharacterized protein n=1 Tax=Oidiodendron maius (strain Zn) TaxID=913774 RepID=A0A0C3HM99_OIDMZ|nr:hypothetical protein OIDMADRAFT_52058 [Oidiodendron maius Zn]
MSTAALAWPPAYLAYISSNDAETTGVNVGTEETTRSKPSVASPTKSHASLERLEEAPGSPALTGEEESASSSNDDFAMASHEQTIISPGIEVQFDGLFIATPPINPKTNPLPYLQRPKSPRPSFTARKYKISILSEDPNAAETAQSTDDISDLANAAQDISINPNFWDE